MIEQRYQEVIDKLISGTQQKKIKWERTSRNSEFKVILGASIVMTDHWVLENGVQCVDLSLLNSDGEIAGRIAFENNEKEGDDYRYLLELYTIAKNSYYKVDETFSEILSNLNFEK